MTQIKCKSVCVTQLTLPSTRKEGYGWSDIKTINNTRGGIESKMWEQGDWGGGVFQVPDVHTFTMFHIKQVFPAF